MTQTHFFADPAPVPPATLIFLNSSAYSCTECMYECI